MALFNSNHTHNYNTTVHEHKAPTDDSIRLAVEMREKALESVIDSIKVQSNSFSGQVAQMIDPATFEKCIVVIFALNGKRFKIKVSYDFMLTLSTNDMRKRYELVAEEMSKAIALELIKDIGEIK